MHDPDNISLTAYRIISIFNLLLEGPCSDKELNEMLQENICIKKPLSKDTICIYINTLRASGCTISRPSKNNDYKYTLNSHPFKVRLSEDSICSFIEAKKYALALKDWKIILSIEKLYNTITENMDVEDKKKFIQIKKDCFRAVEITPFANLINDLEKYCEKKKTLLINYMSPESGEKLITLSIDKLSYENGALYLWGYNPDLNDTQYLRIDRIKDIKIINSDNNEYNFKMSCVLYRLTGTSCLMFTPSEDEVILEKKDNEILIEAKVRNKFNFIQKILSYDSDCTIISPDNIRDEVIATLQAMLKAYK